MADHDLAAALPEDLDDLEVRHVQPYQALKTYRCPGCQQEIRTGTGHEVVVPGRHPDLRRHWHTACWNRALGASDRRRRRRH